jgi:hypothetical protein
MLLYIITPEYDRTTRYLAMRRAQPALWTTIACAMVMLAALTVAQAHVHVSDDVTWQDCSQCVLAKHQLTPAADTAAVAVPPARPGPAPRATAGSPHADAHAHPFRARAPPRH